MTTATVTGKGRITIPVEVRQALRLDSGDRIEFVEIEPGRFEIIAAARSITELKGLFGKASKRASIEDMNQGREAPHPGRHDRLRSTPAPAPHRPPSANPARGG